MRNNFTVTSGSSLEYFETLIEDLRLLETIRRMTAWGTEYNEARPLRRIGISDAEGVCYGD
jgi:hypothetical protein